jgi:hypothetical protein
MTNLGKWMPESIVRDEFLYLNIHVKGVIQFRSGWRDSGPVKDLQHTPNFNVTFAWGLMYPDMSII